MVKVMVGRRWLALGASVSALLLESATAAHDSSQKHGSEDQVTDIVVTGERLPDSYPGGQIARRVQLGVLGDRDLMDTPFNIQGFTSKLIEDQGARTIGDIADNDSAVRSNWSTDAGYFQEEYSVRGFLVNASDVIFQGLYGLVPVQGVPLEGLERVEILKGPGAMLGGVSLHGTVGGAVSVIPKRASDQPITSVTLAYTTKSQVNGAIDIGRRFGSGGKFGIRLNAFRRSGGMALDRQSANQSFVSVGADYLSDRVKITLDAGLNTRSAKAPLTSLAAGPGFAIPRPPRAGRNYQQSWAFMDVRDSYGVLRGEFNLSPSWTMHAAIGHRYTDLDQLVPSYSLIDVAGTLSQRYSYAPRTFDTTSGEVGFRGEVAKDRISHSVVLSASFLRQDQANFTQQLPGVSSNIYKPVLVLLPNSIDLTGRPLKSSESHRASVAFSDTLSVSDGRIQVLLAGRIQQIKTIGFSAAGVPISHYDRTVFTPGFGLIVKPTEKLSFYANYIEGLLQPTAPGGALNAADIFAPLRTRQREIGGRVDFGNFQAGVSLFDTTQPKTLTDPSTLLYGIDGEQGVRGLDLNFAGAPVVGFRLLGGLSLFHGEQVRTAGGINQGKAATGVSDIQVNLGVEADVTSLKGLTLRALALHTGRQYVDAANLQRIPAWTRLDLGARYATDVGGKLMTLRLNVENAFDTAYWASAARDLSLGAPRTGRASISMSF